MSNVYIMSLHSIAEPIYTQIASKSSNAENIMITGIDTLVTAGVHTLGGRGHLIVYNTGNTNSVLSVVSTSANDVVAGTGAQQIRVIGLYVDTADYDRRKPRTALFDMNGITGVNTPVSGTNEFCIVTSVEVVEFGALNSNQGDIIVTSNAGATRMGLIQPNMFKSKVLLHATGHTQTLLIKELHLSSMTQTACTLTLYEQDLETGQRVVVTQIPIGSSHGDVTHPLNHKMEKHKVIWGAITNLEAVTGINHITANITSIRT